MISKLRVKLARWIVGGDPARLLVVHGYGIAKFMTIVGASKVGFITGDGNYYTVLKSTGLEESFQLQCEVCTNIFEANPDKPGRCPSCGSANVGLASGGE